jgi:hypothetical protein
MGKINIVYRFIAVIQMRTVIFKITFTNSLLAIILFAFIISSCTNYDKEYSDHKSREDSCISKSKEWILGNSKFPSSYQTISFSSLGETSIVEPKGWFMRTVPNSERYSLIHKYYLTDKNGQTNLNYSKFVYDKELNLTAFFNYLSDSVDITNIDPETIDDSDWKKLYGK